MNQTERQLFVFWEFGGDNRSWCNQRCGYYYKPDEMYCYGTDHKLMRCFWNGKPELWEKTFEHLDAMHGFAGIYFVMSYGESMGMDGFYNCVDLIGRHPSWTLCIVTNLSLDPTQLVNTRLARERRLFLHCSWHPYGMPNRFLGWENFKKNLLIVRAAGVPVHVLYCWWHPQIRLFPDYFDWLDSHDFRVTVRRFVGKVGGFHLPFFRQKFCFKIYPRDYTEAERGFLYANANPKVAKYGINLVPVTGKLCTAGMDMILVKANGDVALCADTEGSTNLGNVFNPEFKLASEPCRCPSCYCGGDYGMLHLIDEEFGSNPARLPNDGFLSVAEGVRDGHPVFYPKRAEMMFWLQKIRES